QMRPPLGEGLVSTSPSFPLRPRVEMSQTLCRASKATDGSLACWYGPPATVVMRGRNPLVQVEPPLGEGAHPMVDDPPPDTRPTWKADTIVLPKLNVSGSTSVRC